MMRPPLLRVAAMQGKQRALLRTIAPRRGFASGRLVLNHSTNIDGLPTLLRRGRAGRGQAATARRRAGTRAAAAAARRPRADARGPAAHAAMVHAALA